MKVYPTRTGALCANSHPGSYTGQDAFNDMLPVIERNQDEMVRDDRTISGIEHAGLYARSEIYRRGGYSVESDRKYVLRRLTPTECARLQGFPDWWVDGAEGSDSAIYKMWGNGIALPCAADVIGRLARELDK